MTQLGMVIDRNRCIGCRACEIQCKIENNTPRGVFWLHVQRLEEGSYPNVDQTGFHDRCHHCSDPACVPVCPVDPKARFKREEDGIVLTDYEQCIGCGNCEDACPYDIGTLQPRTPETGQYGYGVPDVGKDTLGSGSTAQTTDGAVPAWNNPELDRDIEPRGTWAAGGTQPEGIMGKCTFCVHRQDDETTAGTTACAEACPMGAISFGDLDDPSSDPQTHLEEKSEENTFRYLSAEGTEPNVIFVGPEPTGNGTDINADYKDPETAIQAETAGIETLAQTADTEPNTTTTTEETAPGTVEQTTAAKTTTADEAVGAQAPGLGIPTGVAAIGASLLAAKRWLSGSD